MGKKMKRDSVRLATELERETEEIRNERSESSGVKSQVPGVRVAEGIGGRVKGRRSETRFRSRVRGLAVGKRFQV